jgi:hypothetical protein
MCTLIPTTFLFSLPEIQESREKTVTTETFKQTTVTKETSRETSATRQLQMTIVSTTTPGETKAKPKANILNPPILKEL